MVQFIAQMLFVVLNSGSKKPLTEFLLTVQLKLTYYEGY